MAISNISGYANNYDNLYTSNQMRTNGTDKSSETTSAGQTSEAYLNNLRQKYSNVNITVADFSSEKQLNT